MARPITGSIVEHHGRDGRTYRSLRFTAYGKRRHVKLGAVTAEAAALTLSHVIADVQRGTWQPPEAIVPPPEAEPVPTFHEFAERWWERHEKRYARKTQEDYTWRLSVHLLPYFADMRLDAITYDDVESYIAAKLAEDEPLSPRSINMTVTLLGAILERAVERGMIDRNPARGKDRKVEECSGGRSYLKAAAEIAALLDAAGELDREAHPACRHIQRRAMIATLAFAGLRISELCDLRWRSVDLAGGRLQVEDSKTEAGVRSVKIRGALRDELLRVRDSQSPDAFVFPTLKGGRQSPNNFRARVLRVAIARADERLEASGLPPLPERLTPHALRRTFCSLLYALGESPPVVMREMGHTDPALALKVYAKEMDRGEGEKAALQALVEGGILADSGRRGENEGAEVVAITAAPGAKGADYQAVR